MRSVLGVAPVPAEVRPLRPRTAFCSRCSGSTVASRFVSFPRLVRQAFERLEPCEGKLSCTVLRRLGGSNPARLLDPGLGLVWRETGAVRNARPSRGPSGVHPEEGAVGKDGRSLPF